MKRHLLFFASLLLIPVLPVLIGCWQELAIAANSLPARISRTSHFASDEAMPRISFEKTVCNLGDVGQGTKNTCEFRFTNTGRGLLKIGKISRTCGCTVFQLDKKEYAQNETGTIKVIYTAGPLKINVPTFNRDIACKISR